VQLPALNRRRRRLRWYLGDTGSDGFLAIVRGANYQGMSSRNSFAGKTGDLFY
jgi:hypothetical protein